MTRPVPLDASASPDLRYPRRFGDRYTLLKRLGQGGMGEVFLGVTGQAGVERICALKIVRHFDTDRDAAEMTQRFLDEAKLVTKLSHENLVYVFDFGVVDRQGYLAMEYVAGKTLTEVWNRCAQQRVGFPSGVALFLVSELAAALGNAHATGGLGLVHRDISPSNLMIAYTGGLKVIDFGLAKWKSKVAQTAAGINWGKISYMSPEQHFGRPIDNRSDLYSAGVILWELLTGRQLFATPESRAKQTEIAPPSRFNSHVSPALDRVVLKSLAAEPGDRFQSGVEMSAAILAEMPRDGGKLQTAAFLRQLFAIDIDTETAEQRDLLARASAVSDRTIAEMGEPPAPADADPLVGAVLADRYFVRRRIGEGAMGRVYEGHHTGVGRRVAIKVPRTDERRRAELLERFRREANAASQIGHPNVADVTDCGTTADGDFFFVMEFIDGVDLERLVEREGKLPVERALLIGVQICRAAEAAHRAGIIHRDLKPSNVMLVRRREEGDFVKVLDFGVAKFLRDETGHSGPALLGAGEVHVIGTPRYMAPEQIAAGGEIDFRADLYAVGGILYAMLSGGRAPIEGETLEEVWRGKLHGDPVPLARHRADLPPSLEALVMSCLARDPAARPGSLDALRKGLLEAVELIRGTESAMAIRVPTGGTERRRGRDRRAQREARRLPITVASLLVLGGAVAAGAFVVRAGSTPERPAGNGPALPAAPAEAPSREPPAAAPRRGPAPIDPPPTPVTVESSKPAHQVVARAGEARAPERRPAPAAGAKPAARGRATSEEDPAKLLAEAEAQLATGKSLPSALYGVRKAIKAGAGVRGHLLRARIHAAMDDWEDAAAAYAEALALEPTNEAARRGKNEAERRARASSEGADEP